MYRCPHHTEHLILVRFNINFELYINLEFRSARKINGVSYFYFKKLINASFCTIDKVGGHLPNFLKCKGLKKLTL